MITHVKLVGIPVTDQDRALAFYTEKLGFKVVTDQPFGDGRRWIELKLPRSETKVTLFTPPGQENRIGTPWNGTLACDDVEETHQALSAAGVEIVRKPESQPWGMFMIIRDPDGNELILGSR